MEVVQKAWALHNAQVELPNASAVLHTLVELMGENEETLLQLALNLETEFPREALLAELGETGKANDGLRYAAEFAKSWTRPGNPLGPIAGTGATNYTGAEGSTLSFSNGVVAGCPVVYRLSSKPKQAELEAYMAKLCQEALQLNRASPDWIQTASIPRSDIQKFYHSMATLHFTGGPRGLEFQKWTQNPTQGICQTGAYNVLVVYPGGEDSAISALLKGYNGRFFLSCSAPSGVILAPGVGSKRFVAQLAEALREGYETRERRVLSSYVNDLDNALAERDEVGGKRVLEGPVFHSPSLFSLAGKQWLRMSSPSELFGPAVEVIVPEDETNFQAVLQALPERKTTSIYGPDDLGFGDVDAALLQQTSRVHLSCGWSTPSMASEHYRHATGVNRPDPFAPEWFIEGDYPLPGPAFIGS